MENSFNSQGICLRLDGKMEIEWNVLRSHAEFSMAQERGGKQNQEKSIRGKTESFSRVDAEEDAQGQFEIRQ